MDMQELETVCKALWPDAIWQCTPMLPKEKTVVQPFLSLEELIVKRFLEGRENELLSLIAQTTAKDPAKKERLRKVWLECLNQRGKK